MDRSQSSARCSFQPKQRESRRCPNGGVGGHDDLRVARHEASGAHEDSTRAHIAVVEDVDRAGVGPAAELEAEAANLLDHGGGGADGGRPGRWRRSRTAWRPASAWRPRALDPSAGASTAMRASRMTSSRHASQRSGVGGSWLPWSFLHASTNSRCSTFSHRTRIPPSSSETLPSSSTRNSPVSGSSSTAAAR